METQNINFSFDSVEIRRSIVIDGFGVPSTDFDLPVEIKDKLISSGRNCTL